MQTVDREIIRKEFIEQTHVPPAKIRLPDRVYTLPTIMEVRNVLDDFKVPLYVPEKADCDNRAMLFALESLTAMLLMGHVLGRGWPMAWISIGPHDLNAFVEKETLKIWYVEPSQGTIFPVAEPITWMVIP